MQVRGMPSRTIRGDLNAFGALTRAKQSPRESFSAVVKRTVEPPPARNFSELLLQLREFAGTGVFTPAEREALRRRQKRPRRSRSRE